MHTDCCWFESTLKFHFQDLLSGSLFLKLWLVFNFEEMGGNVTNISPKIYLNIIWSSVMTQSSAFSFSCNVLIGSPQEVCSHKGNRIREVNKTVQMMLS